ncbi:MAG: hypothetical protein FP820_11905 [Sulfurimonas sp.]|jgi:hypothetical protein|nr:hypothetical protein [Sulfurimonas sp.]MBU1217001.1 hypothetical protein [bacterium]MBU1435128.1 hypothetical protein [bacterium]MBU1504233.1 hypothetical protein [bacterium]MBU3938223.1 hypothetical protein [bacterium]
MKKCLKFTNLEEELSDLHDIYKNSLQKEILVIKKIDKSCEKFQKLSDSFSELKLAEYVIFSKFMNKEYHDMEMFVFIDGTGNTTCNLSGRDLDLYNMISECDNLVEAGQY